MSRRTYKSKGSGVLKGGGGHRNQPKFSAILGRPTKNFPKNIHMTNYGELRTVPEYDPALEFEYTMWELDVLAEKILLEDAKPPGDEPAYLTMSMLASRQRREIQTSNGTPDPSILKGMYWKTHPDGRGWRTPEEMKRNSGAFYR